MNRLRSVFVAAVFSSLAVVSCLAQTTEFTYQGSLNSGGTPANGNYDFEFQMYTSLTGATQIGPTLVRNSVPVSNGIFAVKLDFGAVLGATPRFIEIHTRATGGGSFTTLSPRQDISTVPFAVTALSALTANTASNSTGLGGIPASEYLRNTTTPQTANLSITGNASIGGNVGIGTTSPPARFSVVGGGFAANAYIGDSNPIATTLDLENTSAASSWRFQTVGNGDVTRSGDLELWKVGGVNPISVKPNGNVGLSTLSPTATLEVNGYSKLGSDAPAIRIKKLTGTTPATEGGEVQLPLGLDPSKILSVSVIVFDENQNWMGPNYTVQNGFHYSWYMKFGNIHIGNAPGGSVHLLSRPLKIFITYEQ